jgi:hypothetical protein
VIKNGRTLKRSFRLPPDEKKATQKTLKPAGDHSYCASHLIRHALAFSAYKRKAVRDSVSDIKFSDDLPVVPTPSQNAKGQPVRTGLNLILSSACHHLPADYVGPLFFACMSGREQRKRQSDAQFSGKRYIFRFLLSKD